MIFSTKHNSQKTYIIYFFTPHPKHLANDPTLLDLKPGAPSAIEVGCAAKVKGLSHDIGVSWYFIWLQLQQVPQLRPFAPDC